MRVSGPKAHEGAGLWLLKVVAGLLVIVVLGLHFFVNHAVAPEGLLSYREVILYYQNPWVVAMEITFLVVVVTHALIGLRSILLDLNPSSRMLSLANYIFILLGGAAIVYGIWLALLVARQTPPV